MGEREKLSEEKARHEFLQGGLEARIMQKDMMIINCRPASSSSCADGFQVGAGSSAPKVACSC